MKGMIFTKFLEMVEDKWDLEMLDDIITKANDPIDGAYNAVDTYDHKYLVNLVVELHKKTDIPIPDLLQVYGEHLFGELASGYPELIKGMNSTFDMMENIENVIHTEVRKLYPDANPPRFDSNMVSDAEMKLVYHSHRSMADVAVGLIKGCAGHFNENIEVEITEVADNGQRVEFKITKH